jgi:hypothetical protein
VIGTAVINTHLESVTVRKWCKEEEEEKEVFYYRGTQGAYG